MPLKQAIGLLGLLLAQTPIPPVPTASTPTFLEEPDYFIEQEGGRWKLKKPGFQILGPPAATPQQAWTIFEHERRIAVRQRKDALPRLRLNGTLVRFNPLTRQRTPVENWTGQSDAREIEAYVHALLNRFASATIQRLFSSTALYMARLNGASGHTAEEPDDFRRFVVYIDPYRATGRLHVASTLVHELTHLERYRTRGFHVNRAAAVLPKTDFILLGAADELVAQQAEAKFIDAFLDSFGSSTEAVREAARSRMTSPELRWPMALTTLLGFEGPSDDALRMNEARRQVVLDLQGQAARYWDIHHNDALDATLAATIRNWYSGSQEWEEIARQRADWLDAGAQVQARSPVGTTR